MLESISGIQKDGLPEFRAISHQHSAISQNKKLTAES